MNPYYTHQETLNNVLESFDYTQKINCLEFGSGEGSSSIFYKFVSQNKNLQVTCFEHDESWMNQMKQKYQSENYIFNLVEWKTINYEDIKKEHYDLVFVDQGDWDARITTIDELKKNTKIFILHDYCYYNGFVGGMNPSSDMSYNSVDENSFFSKYLDEFDLIPITNLFPPTLVMKSKRK
jgi:hypothetical protein